MFIHGNQPPFLNVVDKMDRGKRFYTTPENNKYPSITTVLGDEPKPWLDSWKAALGKDIKAFFSAEAKTAKAALKEARRLKKDDIKGAEKEYDKAIRSYEAVRKEISKIEDDTVLDWAVSLCIKPLIILVMQASYARYDLKGLTREAALRVIDDMITSIKKEKARMRGGL